MASDYGLEGDTRKAAKILHDNQHAHLWKIPNDLKITSGGFAVFAEQTPCDFMGFNSIGRAVLIECKGCKNASLPMSSRGLKAHQWIALKECHASGGIALVLWRRPNGETAVLDVDMIKAFVNGRRSIPWSKIPKTHIGLYVEDLLLRYITPVVRGSATSRSAASPQS